MNYETGIEVKQDNPLLDGGEEDRRSRRNLILMALGVLLTIVVIAYFVNRSGGAADGANEPKEDRKAWLGTVMRKKCCCPEGLLLLSVLARNGYLDLNIRSWVPW